jgi:uncharacterized membrane protein YoaK (UPF0700 family)
MKIAEIAQEGLIAPVRHVLALGVVAGFVDAMGFIDLKGIYVGAMTGNTVQLGVTFVDHQWPRVALVALALGAYACGAIISSALRRLSPGSVIGLAVMAMLLIAVLVIRLAIPDFHFIELPILAFAMAVQAETVSRFGGVPMQTVVATGALLQFADGLVGRLAGSSSLAEVVIPGCTWVAYAVGAAGEAKAGASLSQLAFLIPIFMLLLTFYDYSRLRHSDRVPKRPALS